MVESDTHSAPSVAERLRAASATLPPAERRVAQVILADYPMSGFSTLAELAQKARTSPPTALRLTTRLGFDGFPAFQATLRQELSVRLAGPLDQYPESAYAASVGSVSHRIVETVESGLSGLDGDVTARIVSLLADVKRPIQLVAGRWSRPVADYLAMYLQLLRPKVRLVDTSQIGRLSDLLEVNRRTVLLAFDYRRYQAETIAYGAAAADQGAEVILFTDPMLSPLAARARSVVATPVALPGSPFMVLVSAFAVVEALAVGLVSALGAEAKERLLAFDRHSGAITAPWPASSLAGAPDTT